MAEVYLAAHSKLTIVGHALDAAYRTKDSHNGKPLVDRETLEDQFPPDRVQLFGPMTFQRMNTIRRDRYLNALGYSFARFIHTPPARSIPIRSAKTA